MATRQQEVPQERPRTIPVEIPGFGTYHMDPRLGVQLNAAVRWAAGDPMMLGQIAQRAQVAEQQVGFEDEPETKPHGHSRLFAQGLISRQELAAAGIPMSEVMQDIRNLGLRIMPQQPGPQITRPVAAPAETTEARLERKGLLAEFQALEAGLTTPPPGPIPVRERGEITPELPKRAGIVEKLQLASAKAMGGEVPQDTVATPEAAEIPPESLGTRLAEVSRKTLASESQIAEVTGDTVATPEAVQIPQQAPPTQVTELTDLGIPLDAGPAPPVELPQEEPKFQLREPTNEGADRLASPYPLEQRRALIEAEKARIRAEGKDPEALDSEGRQIYWERLARATLPKEGEAAPEITPQYTSDLVEVPPPVSEDNPIRVSTTHGNPALRVAENRYREAEQEVIDEDNPFRPRRGSRSPVTVADLKRVSEETGVPALQLAYQMGLPREATTGAEIPFGAAFSRGVYSGLRRYAQIFGADPDPGKLPDRLRESGTARFLGEGLAATPAFLLASGVAGLGMTAMGASARLTPLTYNVARSFTAGAALGIGKTPGGDEFTMGKMVHNMLEEGALWTVFDLGMYGIAGKLGKMAQEGRQIRGIRRQIKGGEQFVDPILLQLEEAVFLNSARDWRAVANRVHKLWKVNPDNQFEAIVGAVLRDANAWGATVLKDLDSVAIKKVIDQIEAAAGEGFSTAVHSAGKKSSLLLLDEAALAGKSAAKRVSKDLFRFQQTGELSEDLLINMLQKGMVDRKGIPPLEVLVRRPETGAVRAEYKFSFGETTNALEQRQIKITIPKDADSKEIITALAHELTHDMIVTKLGRNPQSSAGLIRELFGTGAKKTLKGTERTWMRELRAVQRSLHTRKLGSRKAGLAHIKKNRLDQDEFELLSDFVEYLALSKGRVQHHAPTKWSTINDWVREESTVLRSILDKETVATEAMLREFADVLGSNADDIMKGAKKTGQKASVRKMAVEQRVTAKEALAQFEREGAYDGMRVFLEGRMMEVEKRFFKEGRVKLRSIEREKGRYRTLEVDDIRVQYPTVQGNVRYRETAINIINTIIKQGAPKTLGVFVKDGRGGVGRAIFRSKDMVYFKGSRHDLLDMITQELGEDFVRGLDDVDVFIRYAQEKNLKGVMMDEEAMLTVFSDPAESALHYHDMAPELVERVHGSLESREFILTAEDVIAEGLYQAGIPAREVSSMAEFAMNRKALQLKELIDPDFAPQAIDDIWMDVLDAVHYFDDGGMRSMRHGSGRVTVFPDGKYGIIVNEGQVPGGQIAAIMNSAEEAKAFVAQMAPPPGAPNLSSGSPIPNAFGASGNPRGGAEPFRWGETAESAVRDGGILDRANDLDRNRWQAGHDEILRRSERAGEGLKRLSKLLTSSRTLFQEYEKRGMGPIFKDIWQTSQDAMNNIKTIMNKENPIFGTRKNGKAHSAISGTRAFQRRIQKAVTADRRPLLTQLQQAITKDELGSLVNFSQGSRDVIHLLTGAANKGVDMRHKIAKLTGNMDAAVRYLENPQRFMGMMEAELRGSVPTVQRNLAREMLQFRNDPSKITVESILKGMGHTADEAKLMQGVAERMAKGEDIDLFGIARHFTAGQSRKEFIAAHAMTKEEIALSDELRTYIEEAMRQGPEQLTAEQVVHSTDVFMKTVLPEMKNFVEQGFNINHRTITKYFGNHNEFLHRRMISGDLNVYVNDPGYLAWRTYRGKLMQTHWEPLRQGKIKKAQQVMADVLEGENNMPYKNVERYLEELEGIPHESFAQIEDALIGVFERVGLTEHVAPTLLRDMIQKMNMVTYKATIPFRPLLLVRNASEVYRLGGIVGGRSLGHGIEYVMNPKTRVQAMLEAKMAGALKPDLPVFTVDPSARTAIRGSVIQKMPGGKFTESAAQKVQQGVQLVDDAAEVGMGFYQRVDEYTRSIAYHSMQHRIRTAQKAGLPWNKFIEKSKLSTFDKTELAEFENLWNAGQTDEAIQYAAVTFSDKSLFLYGNANHPVGWGSTYGVLFGQFGTWPVQYKDFMINGMTRGTGKDRLEFAMWNLVAPAAVIHEGKKIGIDLNSWWGVSSLAYSGGPYADASIDVVRAMSGNEAERAMAWSNLRRMNPATTPVPNILVPNSFALNDTYRMLIGEKPWIELLVKTAKE